MDFLREMMLCLLQKLNLEIGALLQSLLMLLIW